ncbi:hypothetical protein [Chondromyces apiculatus]|uniref:Outer membrane component of tripartite multidrug resistance system n=1 Tax=Chondromyces apiculatus DSM 436 TaxID=1192034 RepID=A0A017T7C5_9BACT|nr:hypothetical protein [Chondromyces apiculatus]EYF05153.1 Outer membrane component of tripartite multidrug resistance system [Chondromyces apiculatus DSM 436]
MNRRLAVGVFVLAAVASPGVAPAGPGEPAVRAGEGAAASPAGAPVGVGSPAARGPEGGAVSAGGAEELLLDGEAIPAEASKPPTVAEWLAAPRVKFTRKGPAAAGCRAQMVRAWLRVRCEGQVFAVSLVGGGPEGVAFWIGGPVDAPFGELLTPVRRGDRRVFQLWAPGKDEAGMFAPKPMLVVQEQWIEGQRSPVLTAW